MQLNLDSMEKQIIVFTEQARFTRRFNRDQTTQNPGQQEPQNRRLRFSQTIDHALQLASKNKLLSAKNWFVP